MKYVLIIGNDRFQKYIAYELLKKCRPECLIIENFNSIFTNKFEKIKSAYLYGNIFNVLNKFYNEYKLKKFFKKYNYEFQNLFSNNINFNFDNLLHTSSVNNLDILQQLEKYNFDIIICIGTSIIKSDILKIYENKIFNLHTSILPKYRGVLAEFWALYYADYNNIGVSLHKIKRELDSGDIVAQKKINYNKKDTPAVLRFKNANASIDLII